jgi:Leucine-rich repeat (LRR) protein
MRVFLIIFLLVRQTEMAQINVTCQQNWMLYNYCIINNVSLTADTTISVSSPKLANLIGAQFFNIQVAAIPQNFFQMHPQFVNLNLNMCNVTGFNSSFFSSGQILTGITLQNNSLLEISNGQFQATPSLKTLTIASEPIKSLVKNSFKGLKNLTIFTLTYSKVQNLPVGFFDEPVSLTYIDLSYNLIKGFAVKLFAKLKNLQKLNI